MKSLKKRPIFWILTSALAIALILLAYAAHRIDQLSPIGSILGLYQTDFDVHDIYNAQFYNKDHYYIEHSDRDDASLTTLYEGTFHRVSGSQNVYRLDDTIHDTTFLVTLNHDSFYFYIQEHDRIVELTRRAR